MALTVAGSLIAIERPARATCDGCCELETTLAGWSEDGRSHAVIRRWDGGAGGEALTVIGKRKERVWSAARAGSEETCTEAPRLPGKAARDARRIDVASWKPLRRYALVAVDAAWRDAFDARITVEAIGARTFARDRWELGVSAGDSCTAWAIRDIDGRRLATVPRDCSGGGSSLGTLDVVGGYLHPDGEVALVKVRTRSMGYRSAEHFLRIEL